MALFMNRMNSAGVFFLDEPEAALSPSRQMSLLARLHDLTAHGAQFVIATHSPIVLAYPEATIYEMRPDSAQAYKDNRAAIAALAFAARALDHTIIQAA
jgi:predicted ATPase